MAQITPPVGFNLFVLQGMTASARSAGSRARRFPFFLLMVLMVVLLYVFPQLVTFLPTRCGADAAALTRSGSCAPATMAGRSRPSRRIARRRPGAHHGPTCEASGASA